MVSNSGPGGWTGTWSDTVKERDEFLAEHPEWSIEHIRALDFYEAVRDDVSGKTIIQDRMLGPLMERVKAATRAEQEAATTGAEANAKPPLA